MALMKKQLLSFRDFLKTGSLGPISPDMTMAEIVEVLGMPEHVDPDYWTFGKLEISFDITPPRQMNWFQIEQASYLKGDLEALTTRFALSLDGFSGKTKPSEFLGAGLWTPDQAKVFYAASGHDIGMNICAGPTSDTFSCGCRLHRQPRCRNLFEGLLPVASDGENRFSSRSRQYLFISLPED
ncbi:hypothetical protein [Mesorhizobium sp. M7A.F.Ca.MR.176.00.0.0]|uniref:hypothetical protein n=1 Tax=Mesorhizobium sp. M7A.F.Ca.MR.176.00.0.0 TaxID=2496776 RepID=UPI000FE3E82C|nr:hypothetical protein [Mesorhizobium sp. M7A.F.Ca.MR.176.00.0.0]